MHSALTTHESSLAELKRHAGVTAEDDALLAETRGRARAHRVSRAEFEPTVHRSHQR